MVLDRSESSPNSRSETPSERAARNVIAVEELQMALNNLRKPRETRAKFNYMKVTIDPLSNSKDVKNWLKSKNISDRCINCLGNINGKDLLLLKQDNIIKLCGETEGKRLNSLLVLERNNSKVATLSQELRTKLVLQKEKIDKKMESSD